MGKQKWFFPSENSGVEEERGNEEEEEALSLSDLPNKQENQLKKESPARGCGGGGGGAEEFDFCSWGGSVKESEMCAADEVFFRGQILPLRSSVSSDGGGAAFRSNSRCHSMDRCHSLGYTSASSRSSSTKSLQSSSSGAASAPAVLHSKNQRSRNQFQYSQPSPTPRIRTRNSKLPHSHSASNYSRNSTLWSLFRVGLVAMPEIGSQNFRNRNRENDNRNKVIRNADNRTNGTKNLRQRFSDKNLIFFDACKCSVNSVETVPIKSGKEHHEKKNYKEQSTAATATGKQTISRIRTFEWLKQLSLEGEVPTSDHRLDPKSLS